MGSALGIAVAGDGAIAGAVTSGDAGSRVARGLTGVLALSLGTGFGWAGFFCSGGDGAGGGMETGGAGGGDTGTSFSWIGKICTAMLI